MGDGSDECSSSGGEREDVAVAMKRRRAAHAAPPARLSRYPLWLLLGPLASAAAAAALLVAVPPTEPRAWTLVCSFFAALAALAVCSPPPRPDRLYDPAPPASFSVAPSAPFLAAAAIASLAFALNRGWWRYDPASVPPLALLSCAVAFASAAAVLAFVAQLFGNRAGHCVLDLFFYGGDPAARVPLPLPSVVRPPLKSVLCARAAHLGAAALSLCALATQARTHGGVSVPMVAVCAFAVALALDRTWHEHQLITSLSATAEGTGWSSIVRNVVVYPFALFFAALDAATPVDAVTVPPPVLLAAALLWCIGYAVSRGANAQRHAFRERGASAFIWGERPLVIEAPHEPSKRLLISGWWGIVRRPNYTGDWLMVCALSLVCLWTSGPAALAMAGVVFAFLWSRCAADERDMAARYGNVWDGYCQRVPYRFVPFLV